MTVPCVAIGGITADNCAPLVEAGADFLAVCAGVWQHPEGPAAAVAQFQRCCVPRLARSRRARSGGALERAKARRPVGCYLRGAPFEAVLGPI